MDTETNKPVPAVPPASNNYNVPKRRWPLLKILTSLFFAVLFFAAGIAVGRGDLKVNGLSLQLNTSPSDKLNYSSVDQVYSFIKERF